MTTLRLTDFAGLGEDRGSSPTGPFLTGRLETADRKSRLAHLSGEKEGRSTPARMERAGRRNETARCNEAINARPNK